MAGGIVKFTLQVQDEASGAIKEVAGEAKELDVEQKKVAQSAKITRAEIAGFATAAAGAAVAVAALVRDVVDARNALLDASTRTGVAATTLNGLKLAAEGSGLGFQAMEGVVAGFTNRLAAVAQGSKEAGEAFARLGVSVNDTEGNMRSSDAILRDTITAIQALPTETDRATAATLAFGRQGTKLLQALGTGELEDFVEVANKYGVNVGPGAAKASGDWQRAQAALNLALDGAKASIVESVGGIDGMTDAMLLLGEGVIFGAKMAVIWKDAMLAWLLPIRAIITGFQTLGGVIENVFSGNFRAARDIAVGGLEDIAKSAKEAALTVWNTLPNIKKAVDEIGDFSTDARALTSSRAAAPSGTVPAEVVEAAAAPAKEAVDEVAVALDELAANAYGILAPVEQGLRSIVRMFEAMAGRVGAMLGQAISGNVSGALQAGVMAASRGIGGAIGGAGGAALGGVVGAGIGGAIEGLSALGSEGAGAMVGKISKSINDIAAGFENLPDFIVRLAERLPSLLMNLVTTLLTNLPKMFTALLIKLPVHFAAGLVEWWRGVWQAIRDWFRDLFSFGSDGNGRTSDRERSQGQMVQAATGQGAPDLASMSRIPGRAIGGLIPQTGLYMMHAGETVNRPASMGGNSGTTAAQSRGGMGLAGLGGVTVNVSTPVADSNFADYLSRELERLFGTGGLRSSSVFGG